MSRKSLIICLAALALMIVGVGVAVAFLYSGTDSGSRRENVVPDEERFLLLPAVPADAVFVACLSDTDAAPFMLPSDLPSVSGKVTVSLHFNGSLQTLYVFDTGKAMPEPSEEASSLLAYAEAEGMYSEYVNCSSSTDGKRDIAKRSVVLMSTSETLVKSSQRHLEKSISIMDATGFAEASSAVSGSAVMFFANSHAKTLMAGMFSRKYAAHHPFVANMAQWTVADLSKSDATGTYMNIRPVFGNDPSEFMTVLSKSSSGNSKIAHILPSYTISALSLPIKGIDGYVSAYQSYMDSKQSLQSFRKKQKDLETRAGISPEDFMRRLDVREVAKASFMTGSNVEEVNLLRIENEDTLLFVGLEDKSFRNYVPAIHSWPYRSFISSLFGKYFEIADEECFTYIDGWVISGSRKAVQEYAEGRALSYSLVEYMADAGQKDILSSSDANMIVYHSFTENSKGGSALFSGSFDNVLKPLYSDCDYCPVVMTMANGRDGLEMRVQMPRLTMMKTKAPEFARDTTVVVPEGPFKVKNSGTGQMNEFYQNAQGAIGLRDENGHGLWGFPFKGKLCGTAHNVDYYANGKLQILFGSGSSIYIIDRLGRYVSGFPVDLGKEILVGPDVYDFNNSRAYNIMVLHKDNTIEMYNLKGKKPASWKSITAPEAIKALPERIVVGGNTYWVVRTAIQTLIYPFNGGAAITPFTGDEMIRPDSKIEISDDTSVKVECYNGKTRTVKMK